MKMDIMMDLTISRSSRANVHLTVLWRLQEWVRNLKANNIQPVFANPCRQVVRLFEAARLPQVIGEEFISVRIHDAVTYCQELMADRTSISWIRSVRAQTAWSITAGRQTSLLDRHTLVHQCKNKEVSFHLRAVMGANLRLGCGISEPFCCQR